LMTIRPEKRSKPSFSGAFLVLGLSLGLFGSAALVPFIQKHAEGTRVKGQYPSAFREFEQVVQLNAWDARVVAVKADFLEELYSKTKDQVWKRKADEAYSRVLDLERADGRLKFENARRLTRRFNEGLEDDFSPVLVAWVEAEKAMPLNAFVRLERGMSFTRLSYSKGAVVGRVLWREDALKEYEKAVELEPNFAAAWANLGFSRLEKARRLKDGEEKRAKEDFKKALEIHEKWKDAERIDPLEMQMVSLSPEILDLLRKEISR